MPMASWIAWLNSCVPLQAMLRPAGVRIADQGVAGGEHVDGVAGQRRQRVRHRRDDADDAERGVFLQRDAVLAAERVGAQELDAGDAVGDDLQLLDLVLQPADLGFFQLLAAQRARPARCRSCGCTATALRRSSRPRCSNSRWASAAAATAAVHVLEDAPVARLAVAGRRGGWPLRMWASTSCTTLRISSSVTCMVDDPSFSRRPEGGG